MAYSNLEHGSSRPRSDTLVRLAEVLKADIKDLLASPPEFKSLRFRTSKTMSKRDLDTRSQIIFDVDRWLRDYNELEHMLDISSRTIPSPGEHEPVELARKLRQELGLDQKEPIVDIIGLLEKWGLKFYLGSFSLKGFFGFSVGKDDGGPAIMVNVAESISTERRIFTAAHELGHLLMHKGSFDQGEIGEIEREEQEADRFAGYFLLPGLAFKREWDDAKGLHWTDAVLHIKRKYRVSYRAVLHRLIEQHGLDAREVYSSFAIMMNNRYGISLKDHYEPLSVSEDTAEPDRLSVSDFVEDKLHRMVREAYEQEKISLSRAAEILKISLEEMRALNNGWKEMG
jgi:Zn-dependent peptidase ImmA (M78 family)